MRSCIKMRFSYFLCPAAADPRPAQPEDETDDDHEPERAMDIDEDYIIYDIIFCYMISSYIMYDI